MPLTHYALDTFVSQEMSKLTACAPQSLATEFPERNHWLNQFVLRRIFQNHVSEERAALAFILVRRAEAALDEWELACEAAQDVRKPSGYFKMLRHLENCISALWQGLDFCRCALPTKLFENGDGSVYERLNWVYNIGRHFDPQDLPSGDLHRLWISNDGLHSREHSVTFSELRDSLKFLAGMVGVVIRLVFQHSAGLASISPHGISNVIPARGVSDLITLHFRKFVTMRIATIRKL